jgi:hypothetical protein
MLELERKPLRFAGVIYGVATRVCHLVWIESIGYTGR